MIMNNKNNVFDAKRLIGRRYDDPNIQSDSKLWPFKVVSEGGEPKIEVEYKDEIKRFSPGEISSVVLTKMKEMVEAYLGRTVRDAVITVPANFNVSQRRATKNAGTVAGLNVLRILNEPTAAALAHGLNKNLNKNLKGEHNILIFDLGGGTFDVSILTIDKSSLFEVRATADDTHLGGEDFDNRLVNHLADKFKRKYHKDIRSNLRALQRLRTAAERAKRALSSSTETSLEIDALSEGIDFYTKVSRARFEELCADLFRATLQPVEKALADAQMDKGSIHDVILLGGSSRIPKIQSLLENFFCGKPLDWSINPDEAAVQEVIPTMDTSSQIQSIPVDVVPLSLGIETAGGVMVKIIKRNSPIPCKQTHTFTTYTDNQPIIAIHVFEGERAMAKDNNLLGKFYITGFPPAPRGVCKIEITFDIDANGTLNVSAEEIGTGISQNITIQNDKGRLSQKDIDHLLAEAEHCRGEDEKHKQRMAARYQLSWYICSLKNAIDKRGQKLSKEDKNRVQSLCDDAIRWMDNNTGAEKEAYEAKLKDLQSTCEPVMMKIYEGDGSMRGSCS